MVVVIIQAKAFSFFLYAAHMFWLLFAKKHYIILKIKQIAEMQKKAILFLPY